MKIKTGINWYFFFLIVIFFGCRSRPNEPTFVRYIPKQKYEAKTLLEGVRATKDSLGLDDLEQGYDSLQIRMWFTYAKTDSEQVLTIKRNNGQWHGNFCLASYGLTPRGDSISRYTIHFFRPLVRSDWGEIVDTLLKYNIMTLPDEREVISLDSMISQSKAGRGNVIVEIADRHKYKLYWYFSPFDFKDNVKEAADVCHMAEFISHRLGIQYLGLY